MKNGLNNQLTGGFMKLFVVGFITWFMLTVSCSARSADEMYQIVALKTGVKDVLNTDASWKTCGNYFAAAESTVGKIVHFTYEKGRSTGYTFSPISQIVVSISKYVSTPMVVILVNGHGLRYGLWMNAEDFMAGLPCLANGMQI